MAIQRRTMEQWQTIVQQWQSSNQSAAQFCKDQNLGYASFCSWRKRLTREVLLEPSEAPAQFIRLGALQSDATGWTITLSLGNGVELRLAQN